MGDSLMKDQAQMMIKVKKIEASLAAILSIALILIGLYLFPFSKEIAFDPDIHIGIIQRFFIQNGTLLAGVLGFILSFWQYKAARKMESSEQS